MDRLWNKTVTVYRRADAQVQRQVVRCCHLEKEDVQKLTAGGTRLQRRFFLAVPGSAGELLAGDRIFAGIGPEVSLAQWNTFTPARVPELMEAAYAKPYYIAGVLHHTEAGRRASDD